MCLNLLVTLCPLLHHNTFTYRKTTLQVWEKETTLWFRQMMTFKEKLFFSSFISIRQLHDRENSVFTTPISRPQYQLFRPISGVKIPALLLCSSHPVPFARVNNSINWRSIKFPKNFVAFTDHGIFTIFMVKNNEDIRHKEIKWLDNCRIVVPPYSRN